jgi:sirohydrochlorin cobaltochelatase
VSTSFSDAALLLVGHGSTRNRDSAAPTYQHAAELRRRRIFGQVLEGFYKQEPTLAGVLARIELPRIFVVPLFISEGYFTEEVIPEQLGLRRPGMASYNRVQSAGPSTLHYCAPVGSHPSMTSVILARAREVIEKHPFPRIPKPHETALVIAGHGTDRNENSRRAIERQATLIAAMQVYAEVHAVFMEEKPVVGDCYALAAARNLVVVPFFISDGLHSYEDIPILLGEPERVVRQRLDTGQAPWRNPTEKHGKRLWYARSVGTEPHLADVVLERVQEAAAGSSCECAPSGTDDRVQPT